MRLCESIKVCGYSLTVSIILSGCTPVPPFDYTSNGPGYAPSLARIAAILSNFKCELYYSANNEKDILPRYFDDPSLAQHYDLSIAGQRAQDPTRLFTLKNLFEEIEYVGETEFEIDVTSTTGIAPSLSFINPYSATTNGTWTMGGSLSEQSHRYIYIYTSVDFSRLVYSPPFRNGPNLEGPIAKFAPTQDAPKGADAPTTCDSGLELAGGLQMQEDLAQHFVVADMNDVAVWPTTTDTVIPRIPIANDKYTDDQISFQIDFTTNSGINGGPNWTLLRFKGPSGGGGGGGGGASMTGTGGGSGGNSGLFNYSRTAKDTLLVTLLPVCIRQKYHKTSAHPPYKYEPEFVEGTPRWANYLPPCSGPGISAAKNAALLSAHATNLINSNKFSPLGQ